MRWRAFIHDAFARRCCAVLPAEAACSITHLVPDLLLAGTSALQSRRCHPRAHFQLRVTERACWIPHVRCRHRLRGSGSRCFIQHSTHRGAPLLTVRHVSLLRCWFVPDRSIFRTSEIHGNVASFPQAPVYVYDNWSESTCSNEMFNAYNSADVKIRY